MPALVRLRMLPVVLLLGQACHAQSTDPGVLPQSAPTGAATAAASTAAPPVAQAAQAAQVAKVVVVASGTEGFRPVPRHSYRLDGEGLRADPASNLPQALARALPGITLTHEQGNPLQPSLHFNGFAASPLLGTPQGLSVFQDGVRINEAFGDVVNWDLIPTAAIASMQLVPITDPVFGLNSLGGAIILRTEDGRSAPGGSVELGTGSLGKRVERARYGGHRGDWSYFLAGQNSHDDGVNDYSGGNDRVLFGKLRRQSADSDFDLGYTFARSRLAGAQTLPAEWMSTPGSIYTAPDIVSNRLNFVNLGATQALAAQWQLAWRLSLRNSEQNGFNSNVNSNYAGGPPSPIDPVADNVASSLQQQSRSANLALHHDGRWLGRANDISLGLSLDRQRVDYTQAQQAAGFTPERLSLGLGPFAQAPVDLGVSSRDDGIYFTDRVTLSPWLEALAGGRYESTHIDMSDRLGGALGGVHRYRRFNPSAGVDLHPSNRSSYYLRYAEGMRVPMPVELSCASPAAPCSLPNVLVADPELAPVIARSEQLGGFWHFVGMHLHLEYTRTRLADAIQFISLAGMTQGYFTNIPREDFRSLSLDLGGELQRWRWSLALSHTLATYQSDFLEPSPVNSSADASGNIRVRAGDRLPDIPLLNLKLRLRYRLTDRVQLGSSALAFASRYAQGNENNQDRRGRVPGAAIFGLRLEYRPAPHWHLKLSVDNLFDRVYTDFGQLGINEFTGTQRSFSSNPALWQPTCFLAPGAPRSLWLAVGYAWS